MNRDEKLISAIKESGFYEYKDEKILKKLYKGTGTKWEVIK